MVARGSIARKTRCVAADETHSGGKRAERCPHRLYCHKSAYPSRAPAPHLACSSAESAFHRPATMELTSPSVLRAAGRGQARAGS